jgi:hypothetical protein
LLPVARHSWDPMHSRLAVALGSLRFFTPKWGVDQQISDGGEESASRLVARGLVLMVVRPNVHGFLLLERAKADGEGRNMLFEPKHPGPRPSSIRNCMPKCGAVLQNETDGGGPPRQL